MLEYGMKLHRISAIIARHFYLSQKQNKVAYLKNDSINVTGAMEFRGTRKSLVQSQPPACQFRASSKKATPNT